jgi:hypothetical protein
MALLTAAACPTIGRAQAAATTTTTDTTTTTATPTAAQVQTAPAATPVSSSSETVKMSPFEVQASAKDQGYYTANTLSGTRLNSSLNDLGASITVISKQQLEDTSSIDLNDMFLYEASTEGTENYTALGGFGKGTGVGDTIQASPQTSNRIRGLQPADVSRDFFIINPAIKTDTYNLDAVTISRGPNSSLFGIGSQAGIVNLSIQKANLNQDTNQVSLRFGTYGDERATLNFNRALIPDKLAIDVSGLYQNSHPTGQKPQYDIQRREFAAFTLKPLPNTTIRANIEYYDNPNQRPNSITPADEVTPWINAGRPTWDPTTFTATVNGVTSAPITNNLLLPTGLGLGLGNSNDGHPQMYIVHGQIQLWEQAQLGTNFGAPGTPTNAVGTVNGTGAAATVNIWGPIGNERIVNSQGNFAKFAASAPVGQVTYPLFHEPGISSKQLLNYSGVNMLSNNYGEDKAQIYNVEVEQQIVDNLFLDAGWYREQFNTTQHNYLGGNVGNAIEVDPNTRLINGVPNPYFGRAYTQLEQGDDILVTQLNEQERVSLAYQLDFTKNANWSSWLGHHNMLAFYSHRENDTQSWRYREQVVDAHSWGSTTDIGNGGNGSGGSISQRFYLSDTGAAVSYNPGTFVNTTFTFPVTWYNTALNGGTFTSESTKLAPTLFPTEAKNQQQVWSYSYSLQDYFFKDHLVLTFGQRHDYERNRNTVAVGINPATGLVDLSNLQFWNTANGQPGGWTSADGITRQAGAVLHVPGLKWLSIHYNQSDNFQVAGLALTPFGAVLPNPTGHGKDYGFTVDLFDDKLVGEMNWYKSDASNSREGSTTFVNRALRTDYGGFVPWAQLVATNTLGVNATATAINNFAQNIVQYPGGLNQLTLATQFEGDTQIVQAKGWEIGLTYNPTRQWTMKFTADQDVAIYTGVFPNIQAYLAARLPIWIKATDPILGSFWTTVPFPASNSAGIGTSGQAWLAGTVDAAGLDVQLAQQGHVSPDLSKYHFTYLTNYQFVSGVAKGFGLGTALTYQTPSAIGYLGAAPDPSALGAIDGLQAFNPINGKEVLHQDFWISYRTKLPFLDDRIRMQIQLNVKDMWSNGYLRTVQVNPDGTPQAFRIIPPRRFYLTTTFDF